MRRFERLFSAARKRFVFGRPQAGFTLVELLVAMILTVAFSILVLSFMIDFWRSTATLQSDSETLVTRQNAGDRLRTALNVGTHLIDQNSIVDLNADDPDPSDGTGTFWVLIHAIPSSITMPASGSITPVFYFEAPSVNSSESLIMNGTQPYYDEFVLYLKGSTKQMLMRTLANPNATGDKLTTSCPPPLASSSCPPDTVIAGDVTSVDTRYFSRSGNTVDYTSVTDPSTGGYIGPDFPAVDVVELTLHIGRKSVVHGGQDTSNETIVRVALRNS